jgi:hypothetical protein
VTYGHHALIAGNRKGAIIGTFLTIIFAILFTLLQYYEYSEAAFTMSDSVYGSAFFASTGLHGLTFIVPNKFIKHNICKFKKIQYIDKIKHLTTNSIISTNKKEFKNETLLIQISQSGKKNKTFYLDSKFLEWLSGFTDAEGNFNISLRNLSNNKYNSVILTFQICLYIDDIKLLKFIKQTLNCGHISISGSRCNYFVNDQKSLIHIILPIFNFVKLNSSKYYQYLIFEKAINLIKFKNHLSPEGKLKMIKYYHEIKFTHLAPSSKEKNNLPLTDY